MEGIVRGGQEGGAPLPPGAPGLGRCPAQGPGARGARRPFLSESAGRVVWGWGTGASRKLLPVVSPPRTNH